MNVPRVALALLSALLFACGGSTQKPQELPAPATILTFGADKVRIQSGQSVTLSFSSRNAQSAVLTDQSGQVVTFTGDASGGTATVTPSRSTFYLLRVTGEGGGDSGFVQVAVDKALEEVFLVATPSTIDSGQSTYLLWSAFHADSARIESDSGEPIDLDVTQGSGVIEVAPARTTSYSLVGARFDGPRSISAQVEVNPVLRSFEAVPSTAKVGEHIIFHWKTAGAAQVLLTESTFGELSKVSHPAETAQVDDGAFEWTVPAQLPDGTSVRDGQPLHFTLTVSQVGPAITLTRTLESFVGDGPRIADFTAPDAVTVGGKVRLGWRTARAQRLQILANGLPVFEPPSFDQDQLDHGDLVLPCPSASTTYELVAWGQEGTGVSQARQVRVVAAPSIDSFTLTPVVTTPGDVAAAQWATHGATSISLRVKNGPVIFDERRPASVQAGSTEVYPGLRATFVLEAWNDAGDKVTAERTVDVASAGALSASVSPVTAGDPVTYTWSVDSTHLDAVIGDPNDEPVETHSPQNFFDLSVDPSARSLFMAEGDESVSQLDVAFRFPFLGPVIEKFYASTNGFVAFDPKAAALGQNGDLGDTSALIPAMIAPFWDDLELGQDGRILYAVDGSTFPRRLTIQWDHVHAGPGSDLTFQVQLLESGEFRFIYKSLAGAGSDGVGATVGWRANRSLAQTFSRDRATLTAGGQVDFLGSGAASGQVTYAPEKPGAFTLFARATDGHYVVLPASVNVLVPGSIRINEVMSAPPAPVTDGQWVELFNTTQDAIDLSGTTLDSSSSTFPLPQGTVLPAGGYLVIGQSSDAAQNGGATVHLAWTGFNLASAADVVQLAATNPVSTLAFTAANVVPGSTVLYGGDNVINAAGAPYVCSSKSQTFGTAGSKGTPGGPNEVCFPYTVSKIGSAFEDITLSGTPISLFSYDRIFRVDLSSAPFSFFGTPRNSAWVTSDGELTFTSYKPDQLTYQKDNPLTPNDPNIKNHGMMAPFWDDLYPSPQPGILGDILTARLPARGNVPARWIIQWTHFSKQAIAPIDSDFNFEVKLFDDGTFEYHYDVMNYGVQTPVPPDGKSATIWVAAPDFSSALPVGINQSVLGANTAFRFAPIP